MSAAISEQDLLDAIRNSSMEARGRVLRELLKSGFARNRTSHSPADEAEMASRLGTLSEARDLQEYIQTLGSPASGSS
jgi:hypothetical protein